MNLRLRVGLIAGTALVIAAPLAALAVADQDPATGAVNRTTAQSLRYIREEERAARDLYTALADAHDGARPMSMISWSEARHFAAVGGLLSSHDIADPAAGRKPGSYAFDDLQRRYDDWLARGSRSKAAAYQVGIELERADIADLKTAIADTDESDVKTVLSGLLVGSRHHLAAYTAAASGQLPAPGTGMGPGRWDRQDPDAVAPGNGMGPGNGIGPGNGMGNRTDGDAGPGGWGHHGGDCPWG